MKSTFFLIIVVLLAVPSVGWSQQGGFSLNNVWGWNYIPGSTLGYPDTNNIGMKLEPKKIPIYNPHDSVMRVKAGGGNFKYGGPDEWAFQIELRKNLGGCSLSIQIQC